MKQVSIVERVALAIVGLVIMDLAFLNWLATPARAWDIDKMNAQIDDTNVIVGQGCSGTVVSIPQRLVVTAFHCVDDLFQEVTERVPDPKTGEIKEVTKQKLIPLQISMRKVHDYEIVGTEEHRAKIVGSDPLADIALIQVIDVDFKPAEQAAIASELYSYARGQKIYVIGNPSVTFDNSITEGIISFSQRMIDIGDKRLKTFQIGVPVIGGNSGGSVRNDDGAMIGTLSAGVRGSAVSFAVPISYTRDMIKKAGFGSILPAEHNDRGH